MLTKNITRTVEIPHEPGYNFTFRQLSWVQIAEAEDARSASVLRNLRAMGGELMRELQGVSGSDQPQTTNMVDRLDKATVLKHGIAAWNYDEPVNAENIGLLDVATADWAMAEILKLGAPPIDAKLETDFLASRPSSTAIATVSTTYPANGSSD